ncbi:MAG: SPASM domain-containing protein [Anaerolineae bacterium]|nr:SPASM domain-containing protein [Anaerolineae bacterium]
MNNIDNQNLYKVSRFVHFVQLDNYFAIYNSINLAIIFVNIELFPLFKNLNRANESGKSISQFHSLLKETPESQNLLEQLLNHKMLVDCAMDETEECKKWVNVLKSLPIGVLYLLTTDSCNFACRYCVIMGNMTHNKKPILMTNEIAKERLDFFADLLARQNVHGNNPYHLLAQEPQIIIYGGEPLLNLNTLKFILEYIRTLKHNNMLPVATNITLNTNGSLITKEVADLLALNIVNVSVSLDGFREHQNRERPLITGSGSFDDVLRGYKLLKQSGCNVSISCTLGSHNLKDALQIVDWFIDELKVEGFGFNMLVDSEVVKLGNVQEYADQVSTIMLQCFEKARIKGVYEDRIMRKAKSFVEGKIYLNDCAGCGQQIVVSPDGQIGPCQAYLGSNKNFIIPDEDFDPANHPIWNEWRMRSPLNMPQCMDCIALGICGGGCPYDAEIRGGSIWSLDEAFCIHSKKTLSYLIKDLWSNIQTGMNN